MVLNFKNSDNGDRRITDIYNNYSRSSNHGGNYYCQSWIQKRSCDFMTDRPTRQQFVTPSSDAECYHVEYMKSRERIKTTCDVCVYDC